VPVECEVTIYSPCFDPDFFVIVPVDIQDIECTIFGDGCQWTHPGFDIIAAPEVIEICIIVYNIVSDIDIYITYDVDLHIIIFYCEDMSLIDLSFTYTITVTIEGYTGDCGCISCCGYSSGTIVIVSPCVHPVIDIGIIINIDFDFDITGPSIWNPPPCVVEPPICYPEIIYTCIYVRGPYTGPYDLCNFTSYTNVNINISFDISTGVFVFDTDDTGTFPPGVYVFQITITIGVTIQTQEFSLTIIGHCDTPVLTIVHQPLPQNWYHIGDGPVVIFSYSLTTIVTTTVATPCGDPVLVFMTSTGFELEIVFSYDITCVLDICDLIIDTSDVAFAGDYSIQFFFFYSGMPSCIIYSNIFVVTVVNICVPPPGCIGIPGCGIPDPTIVVPVIDIDINVTVTVDVTIDLPSWGCGTPGCDTEVIVDCTINCDIGGGGVVVIVNNEINIHIDSCAGGICGDTPAGNTIIIVIEGCLGVIC
jgi:hypothetical protein